VAAPNPRTLNRPQWSGDDGRYEGWYVKANDPDRDASAWLRYSLLAPDEGDRVAQVWAVVHDGDAAHAERVDTSPEALELGEDPLYRSEHGTLRRDGCTGEAGPVSWDLSWTPNDYGFAHLPGLLYKLPRVRTRTVTPNPDLRLDGEIQIGMETWGLEGCPGQQGHVWGRKHGDGWAWAHANADGGPTWEALSARLPGPLRRLGPLTALLVRWKGETIAVRGVRKTDSAWSHQGWNLAGHDGEHKIEIDVAVDPKQMDGVTYTDPDGEASYCHNTKRADARLRLMERDGGGWDEVGEWSWQRTAAFEVGDREPDPEVPWVIDQ
jgi:hypothetical protein